MVVKLSRLNLSLRQTIRENTIFLQSNMKLLAYTTSLTLSAIAAKDSTLALRSKFESWKIEHGKSYETSENERVFKIFGDNSNFIENHNTRFNSGEETYQVGLNKFADLSKSEFYQIFLAQNEDHGDMSLDAAQACYQRFFDPYEHQECMGCYDVSVKEQAYDWSKPEHNRYNRQMSTQVKDQGSCGSCWAFAAAATLEGYVCKNYYQDCSKWTGISAQNYVDCNLCGADGQDTNGLTGDICSWGCSGGNSQSAWEYTMANKGAANWDDYKYTSGQSGTEDACTYQSSTNALSNGGQVYGCGHSVHNDEAALADALYAEGPVKVSIDASSQGFHFYQSGVFTDYECSNDHTNHAVTAVGYGVLDGMKYFKIKNSWGNWGENGYIKMRRDNGNMCALARKPYYPLFQ